MTENQMLSRICELDAQLEEAKHQISRLTHKNNELQRYIEKLEYRLEIDRYYTWDEQKRDFKRIDVAPEDRHKQIDGIEARDETINLLQESIEKLKNKIKQHGVK